jgi:imidazoleglycerol phosphate dehydratase HisB
MNKDELSELIERSRPMRSTIITLRVEGIGACITEVECDPRSGFEQTAAKQVARVSLDAFMDGVIEHHEMGSVLKNLGQIMQDAKDPRKHTTQN